MATTIITKNGSGAPVAGDLVQGELAVDLTNKEVYTKDSNGAVIKVGSASDDSGIPEAPEDGKQYAREDATWTEVPPAGISDAPSDGKQYAREDATWTEVVPTPPTTSLPASAITDGAMEFTGSINLSGEFVETVRDVSYSGGNATLELNLANNFTMDFSGATSYTVGLSGAPSAAGDAYGCTLTLDTTSMDALVWDDKIKWSTGTAPALTADVTYVFTLITTDGGTTFKGFVGGEAFA